MRTIEEQDYALQCLTLAAQLGREPEDTVEAAERYFEFVIGEDGEKARS